MALLKHPCMLLFRLFTTIKLWMRLVLLQKVSTGVYYGCGGNATVCVIRLCKGHCALRMRSGNGALGRCASRTLNLVWVECTSEHM